MQALQTGHPVHPVRPPPLRYDWTQVVPAKAGLLQDLCEKLVEKDEPGLRRLINESEEIAAQRDEVRKRLTLLQRASREIATFM